MFRIARRIILFIFWLATLSGCAASSQSPLASCRGSSFPLNQVATSEVLK
jgi:hypothetical protein